MLDGLFSFQPRQIEKVAQCVELVAANENRELRGQRGSIFGRVQAIDQRCRRNRQSSNATWFWTCHLQSRIKLSRLFALCVVGTALRRSVLAVRSTLSALIGCNRG